MKKLLTLISVLVLTAMLFVGCGCRNSKPATTSAPTTMPTIATTQPTTAPTTMATQPQTMPTIEDGNGPMPTDDTASADTTEETNARSRSGGITGNGGMIGSGNGITGSIG